MRYAIINLFRCFVRQEPPSQRANNFNGASLYTFIRRVLFGGILFLKSYYIIIIWQCFQIYDLQIFEPKSTFTR